MSQVGKPEQYTSKEQRSRMHDLICAMQDENRLFTEISRANNQALDLIRNGQRYGMPPEKVLKQVESILSRFEGQCDNRGYGFGSG